MFSLDNIPSVLHDTANLHIQHFTDALTRINQDLPENQQVIATLPSVFCYSEFVAQTCARQPNFLLDLINSGDLLNAEIRGDYKNRLYSFTIQNDVALMKALRQFRNKHMLRIAWRDLAGWSELDETLLDLTALAESCIQFTLDYLYQHACHKFGTPVLSDGSEQQLIILGMGKLGAWELNYSSDIDLIFAYQQDGVLADRKETSYGEFFSRICRQLVKILDEITADGFVFRTDIRLRPFGDSGPVIMTFEGLEQYYQTQAREWERYAMVKARPVAGNKQGGEQFMAMIKPFIYRRYLDFSAFEELRSLKQQITQELQRKDRMDNIKLGPGGIREIEFIGQAFQLIRGGQDSALQQRSIQPILALLGEKRLISVNDSQHLISAYRYLRRVENHIQEFQDKQTHELPKTELEQTILAFSLGYVDWESFKAELDAVRTQVQNVFVEVFSMQEVDAPPKSSEQIWMGRADDEASLNQLADLGYRKPEQILTRLLQLKANPTIKRLSRKGANTLDKLMPQILDMLAKDQNAYATLQRLCALFEAMAGRNVYLSLLVENEHALQQLITLTAASPWIGEYLSQYPSLFDELLDTRSLYEPLDKAALEQQLSTQIAKIDAGDIEQLMIALRNFKQINVLRVAAADIMGAVPLMVVSDELSYIAEVILQQAVKIAWTILTEKHGLPPGASVQNMHFGIVGFGKLGGIELSYSSDLDLVFIHDYQDSNALTDGPKQITSAKFYANLGQRVRSLLNTQMLSGMAYEIDMRLRPNGESGLLVTQLNSYEQYLQKEAWTWEHQALVRGRYITGDTGTEAKYQAIRNSVLTVARNQVDLKQEVREMREKMRDSLDSSNLQTFNLKQGKGGITDIEFIVQYYVLAYSEKHPELTQFTDNMRLLDTLAEQQLLSEEYVSTLKKAYCIFRDRGHKEALQGNKALIAQDELVVIRQQIADIWQVIMT
ncbi:bifunctional [glutamate--ammonia ligase]-adenylyl-L-tyrosine phosphorylase/[glutamate--ammonia-ligase] adenylyltransferase [Methyloprofundus sp.]|uniref:bifunctional [glutamate--ammonia ligase]-adenylyl-L-tyrosine phosphorylase/[glutamate--ammonia-ligase] adenylyltransferase n=1 Tax=Methyloprofundus sp. TaxID=2020875 RepID=UPI003D0A3BE8